MSKLRLVDLFSGAGGMTRGFVDADFTPIFAVDIEPWSVRTYEENFGSAHAVCAPIEKVDSFPSTDVLIGGPPCQGFSLLGENNPNHPLNTLWRHYYRAVLEAEPRVFVMENVPQLLKSDHYRHFRESVRDRYDVWEGVLNAADYGVPQTRRRAIVIGSAIGTAASLVPIESHSTPTTPKLNTQPWRTFRDELGDIPLEPRYSRDADWDPEEPKSGVRLHVGRHPTPSSLERYRAIPEGGNRWDLYRNRPDLTPGCWIRKTSGGTDLMGRLWWDRPAFTIRTEFFKPEKGRYLHPTADRPITHWEAARLQKFPDTFRFVGSKIQVARQIGNAVPVLLAKAIATSIATALAGSEEQRTAVAV